jgi:hypothetical protein
VDQEWSFGLRLPALYYLAYGLLCDLTVAALGPRPSAIDPSRLLREVRWLAVDSARRRCPPGSPLLLLPLQLSTSKPY